MAHTSKSTSIPALFLVLTIGCIQRTPTLIPYYVLMRYPREFCILCDAQMHRGIGGLFPAYQAVPPVRGCQPEKVVSPCNLASQRGCLFFCNLHKDTVCATLTGVLEVAHVSILITSFRSHSRFSLVSVLPTVSPIHRENTDHPPCLLKKLIIQGARVAPASIQMVPRFSNERVLHVGTSTQTLGTLAASQLEW